MTTRLHTIVAGAGDPPILFVHGMGTSSSSWARCLELLAPLHRVCAVDLLGHGASPVPDDRAEYTRDRALADLDDVIADPVIGLGTHPVLVGHSLGGYLALAHAATRPGVARAIVVLNTGPGFRNPERREAWNERSRRNAHRFGVPPQVADLNLQADSVVIDHLAEITIPVLVLVGGDDRPDYATSGEYLERSMPDARCEVIEGGGHSMHEDTHAEHIARRIHQFVAPLATHGDG